MNLVTRRGTLKNVVIGLSLAVAGCVGQVTDLGSTPQFKLESILIENASDRSLEFSLQILDGEEVQLEQEVSLNPLTNSRSDSIVIHEEWMDSPGRYGFKIETKGGRTVSHTLDEVLNERSDNPQDKEYIQYTISHRIDYSFGIFVDFLDEKATETGQQIADSNR